LLVNGDGGGNEVVRNRNLLVFGKEDALIGLRPHVVQTLDLFLPSKIGGSATGMEMINRIWHHHFRRKDFLVATGNFQETMPVKRLKEKPMPWVRRDRKALFDPDV
jgi:hypothetical protein